MLARPKFAVASGDGRAKDFVGALRVGATMAEDPPAEGAITRDPKDDYLVRLTRTSGATVLVSGDRDLLEAPVEDIAVLTPRAFLDGLDGPTR